MSEEEACGYGQGREDEVIADVVLSPLRQELLPENVHRIRRRHGKNDVPWISTNVFFLRGFAENSVTEGMTANRIRGRITAATGVFIARF